MVQESLLGYLSIHSVYEWRGVERFGEDLSAFCEHGHRNEVTSVDVVYCSTKNEELVGMSMGVEL